MPGANTCIQDVTSSCGNLVVMVYILVSVFNEIFESHTHHVLSIQLKSVRVHFAYGRIALTLELLGRFGQFLDEDDRCNPPVLLIPFPRLLGL